ncbi:cell wall / vacuolar inhibitor of fructosidase 2-like [Silene latifolia]|uniref:cell wall / vacuolar inhibitor of fructosidase 2-like n=1 Tax=Silene latifolia TaxID=37657 RepID=UPI003D781A8C
MSPKIPNNFYILSIFLILYTTINPSTNLATADDELIRKTCKTTKYIDLCISSLKSDPTSSQSDLKGLATIMINVGILNATDTYSYLSTQLQSSSTSTTTSDATLKKVVTLCAQKYYNANDSLNSCNDDLSFDNYDYAIMHVTAAADYPNVCHNAFRRYRGVAYPSALKVREDGLKKICGVVLGILNQLYNDMGNP